MQKENRSQSFACCGLAMPRDGGSNDLGRSDQKVGEKDLNPSQVGKGLQQVGPKDFPSAVLSTGP